MKVLLVDDHQLIREGMRPVLANLVDGSEVLEIFEASTFEDAARQIVEHPDLDLVLLDLRLPDVMGFEALDRLERDHPGTPVVIMSGEDDAESVIEALERGALGYIPKSSSSQVILHALRLVLSGATYVPREIMSASAPAGKTLTAPRSLSLTTRQSDVLALILAGKSNKQICRELDMAEGTVKAHIQAIFRALNVTTRVQAVVAAGKLGIKA